jgi:hypothetical protein
MAVHSVNSSLAKEDHMSEDARLVYVPGRLFWLNGNIEDLAELVK